MKLGGSGRFVGTVNYFARALPMRPAPLGYRSRASVTGLLQARDTTRAIGGYHAAPDTAHLYNLYHFNCPLSAWCTRSICARQRAG